MQIKRIICPNCRVVLEVKNSHNESLKQITCPSCKCVLQVSFAPQQEPLDAKTYYAPSQKDTDNNGATQLATDLPMKKASVSLVCNGITYPLEEGQNIVGRMGKTSKATVQIVTDDRYMSRQHCAVTVTTLADGTKKTVLSNYQNKNLTSVDGQEIETGDAIRLTDGNIITMGHTTVTFKIT